VRAIVAKTKTVRVLYTLPDAETLKCSKEPLLMPQRELYGFPLNRKGATTADAVLAFLRDRNPRGVVDPKRGAPLVSMSFEDAFTKHWGRSNFIFFDAERLKSKPLFDEGCVFSDGVDVWSEGCIINRGPTLTRWHVEDQCLATLCTLAPIHGKRGCFKVWCLARPTTGQQARRAVSSNWLECLEHAETVIVQREGDSVYIPPLHYHTVQTFFCQHVEATLRFSVLCGVGLADTREGSIWRRRIAAWAANHHTGHSHGSMDAVREDYRQFVKKPKPPTSRKRNRFSRAVSARWEKRQLAEKQEDDKEGRGG
jgi:hypothetical protein